MKDEITETDDLDPFVLDPFMETNTKMILQQIAEKVKMDLSANP